MRDYRYWTIEEHWRLIELLESGKGYTAGQLALRIPGKSRNAIIGYMRNNEMPLPNAGTFLGRWKPKHEEATK